MLDNEQFLLQDNYKQIYDEVLSLADDALEYYPLDKKFVNPMIEFVMNGLQPLSQGILVGLLTGNIVSCFMQLRLLVEYLAMTSHANKISEGHLLEKFEKIRQDYDQKTLSEMIGKFDKDALSLWKNLSNWHHAKTHSDKIEKTIINEGVKLWSIIQPAPYSSGDVKELLELKNSVEQFRKLLQKHVFVS